MTIMQNTGTARRRSHCFLDSFFLDSKKFTSYGLLCSLYAEAAEKVRQIAVEVSNI